MREKGERVRVLSEERKEGGREDSDPNGIGIGQIDFIELYK